MGTVTIVSPGPTPSPFPIHRIFSTFGRVSGATASSTTMTATIQQSGSTVATGVWNNSPPTGNDWQFDFNIPQSVSGNATLVVTCTGATQATRSVSIS